MSRPPAGITLVELVVVLVLLGVAAATVAPVLERVAPAPVSSRDAALVRARALAARRAEPVLVLPGPAGQWDVIPEASAVDAGGAAARVPAVRVSPTGACLPRGGSAREPWDPARCAPAR